MTGGIDSKYLKDLQQVLEAEAALARQGVDLLADPEYRALRERFIDGDMPIEEFVGRLEGLAEIRPEDGEAGVAGGDGTGDGADGADPDEDLDDLDDLDDLEDLRLLEQFRSPDDASGADGSERTDREEGLDPDEDEKND
jgi:hypothetical protein